MKKLFVIITFILALLILPVSALADVTEGSATPETTKATNGTSFVIDNAHIYDGMDKAYKDGYTLTVKNGVATVVLPLTASV